MKNTSERKTDTPPTFRKVAGNEVAQIHNQSHCLLIRGYSLLRNHNHNRNHNRNPNHNQKNYKYNHYYHQICNQHIRIQAAK